MSAPASESKSSRPHGIDLHMVAARRWAAVAAFLPSTCGTSDTTVWGPEYAADTQLLRVYIGQLRARIEERPERPALVITEPGIGYRFRDTA